MRVQRINRVRSILFASALGFIAATGPVHAELVFDETPTIQEAAKLLQDQNWHEAVSVLRAIVKEDPKSGEAQFLLGFALHASGDIGNAILAHKKATRYPAFAAGAFYNLGCAYAIEGNASDAFKALDSAIAMGIREKEQFTKDPDLKSLKRDERWKPMLKSMKELTEAETALHFWVGSWDCYDAETGELFGKNTLELRVGTNVVHESWESSDGTLKGESWSVYNRDTNTWEQTWIDSTGSLLKTEAIVGSEEFDGLMFEGKKLSPGKKAELTRMHIRSTKDGHLLQSGFTSKNRGKTWKQAYELIYVPSGEAFVFEPKDNDD